MKLPAEDRERVKGLTEALSKHVAMVVMLPHAAAEPSEIVASATMSFVQTPERQILLTNAHVWTAFLENKANAPTTELALAGPGGVVFISDATPIAVDTERDIAVLACDRPEEVASIGKTFYVPKVWPLRPPQDGAEVLFVGFPGIHRTASGNKLNAVFSLFAPVVVGVGAKAVRLQFTNPDRFNEQFKEDLKPFGPLGGVSGSALYRVVPGTSAFDLTGCVFSASEGLSTFKAALLDCLKADGTLGG